MHNKLLSRSSLISLPGIILSFLMCSKEPIKDFTVSGKLRIDEGSYSYQDTLDYESDGEVRIGAFLRRYYPELSQHKDTLVSNEVQIKYNKDNKFKLDIVTSNITLGQFEDMYILCYLYKENDPYRFEQYIYSDSTCPVFKGNIAAFKYSTSNGGILNQYEKGWNIYGDYSGCLEKENLSDASLRVNFN